MSELKEASQGGQDKVFEGCPTMDEILEYFGFSEEEIQKVRETKINEYIIRGPTRARIEGLGKID